MAIKIIVVGAGYMGRAHCRVLSSLSEEFDLEIKAIVDPVLSKAEALARKYGGRAYKSVDEALENTYDAGIIASPTSTHIEVADKLLEAGVEYLLIEKPLSHDTREALKLAQKHPGSLDKIMVGHIERFNKGFRALLEAYRKGLIGEIISISSRRVGPFTGRIRDAGVILDLAIHDIDLARVLCGRDPKAVIAYTYNIYSSEFEDSSHIILEFDKHIAYIEANRVTPYKERKCIVTGTRGVAQLDFIKQSLELYNGEWRMERNIVWEEPLLMEDRAFVESVANCSRVPIGFREGFRALEIAMLAVESGRRRCRMEVKEASHTLRL